MSQPVRSVGSTSETKRHLREYLASAGTTTFADLRATTGLDSGTLFAVTNELVAEGVVARIDPFTFRPVESAAQSDAGEPAPEPATSSAASSPTDDREPGAADRPPQRSGWRTDHADDRPASEPATPVRGTHANQERAWGAVLLVVGAAVTLLAVGAAYSVLAGGVFGILSVRAATAAGVALAAIGGIGLVQGLRAHQGWGT